MVTWSNSSDVDPFYEATFQCGFGINEMHTYESETKIRRKKEHKNDHKNENPKLRELRYTRANTSNIQSITIVNVDLVQFQCRGSFL